MGITYVSGTVRGPAGRQADLDFLVDSGAAYSLIPHRVWNELQLQPTREQEFRLADGTVVRRRVSECYIALREGEGHTPVVLGEPGDDTALLGAITLENLGLMFNPFSRTLHPLRALLV
jgi:clan AA aspartic protease